MKNRRFPIESQEKAREELRKWAIKWTGGCTVQEGKDGKAYPCGTCFCALLGGLIDEKSEMYKEHNEPVDRINEVWRFILEMRDMDYGKAKK